MLQTTEERARQIEPMRAEQHVEAAQEVADAQQTRWVHFEDEALLDALQAAREQVARQRDLVGEMEAELLVRMQARNVSECAAGAWVARLSKATDSCRVRRDWFLGLVRERTLTDAEAQGCLPAEIKVGVRGWEMLERRGLLPDTYGERRPGLVSVSVKPRKGASSE